MLKKILSTAAAMSVFFNMTFAVTDNLQAYISVFAEDNGEISETAAPEVTPGTTSEPEEDPEGSPSPTPSPTRTPRPARTPRPTDDPVATPSPTPSLAENKDLSVGDIIIYKNGTYEIEDVRSEYHIIVKDNVDDAEIVLYNTEIISDGPVQIGKNCGVSIVYDGTNTIESTSDKPAVLLPKGSTLNLEGSGTLSAVSSGAAVGSDNTDAGVININSGTLTVRSTGKGAGIGGGNNKNASEININGGTVDASAVSGAAIGGGAGGKSGNITITGGKVTAVSEKGAGIGGGSGDGSENITVSGGEISAVSEKGAAIGGGENGKSENITITGGNIEVRCGSGCAAIGGGYKKSGGNINVSGGTVVGFAGEYGRIIGGGRYSSSSKVQISGNADISGYVKEGACAVEENEISGNMPMICAFYNYNNRSTYNKTEIPSAEQTVKLSCGAYSDKITLPADYHGFFRTLKTAGTYSLKTDADDPIKHIVYKTSSSTVSNSSQSESYSISAGINHFELVLSDSCYLETPKFTTNDIVLSKDEIKKNVTLSAYTTRISPVTCSSSAHRSALIKYSYEIVSDESKIASLKDRTLTIEVSESGVYQLGIKVTAVCGNLSAEKTQVLNVVKQSFPHDINSKDLNITQNGIYTVYGSTIRYNINVASDLDDVNIIFNSGVSIDMSKDTTARKSPVIAGNNSKVTLTVPSSVVLKSSDNGACIEGGKNSEITINGNSSSSSSSPVRLESSDTGSCITGGTVYLLGGNFNLSAEKGDIIKADKIFIADNVYRFTVWSENSKNYPINTVYMTEPYQSYKPAYIVQGKLSGSMGSDGGSISVKRTTTVNNNQSNRYKNSQGETVSISSVSKDCKAFAVKVDTYGNYKVSGNSSKVYTVKDGNRNIDEVTLEEEKTYITSNIYSQSTCKCKVTAPAFSMENVIMPYEKSTVSYLLDADSAEFILDKDCRTHTSARIYYDYDIDDDKGNIAYINNDRIYFDAYKPGKYTVKLTATARVNDISASKSISVSVTKLGKEETDQQRGDLHRAYIQGYDDGTFRPDSNITRAEAATILTSALEIDDYDDPETAFFDVSRKAWYYDTVLAAEQAGIFSGYEDGSFKPDNNITRAEFTVAVCNAFGIEIKSSASKSKSKMGDVSEHWSRSYVDALVKTKYINGYDDGTFKPDNNITRAEAVAILNRAMSRSADGKKMSEIRVNNPFDDIKKTHWAFYDIIEAVNDHYSKEWHNK